MELKAVIAVYRVHWGLSSRAWLGSASQLSYLLPPPTTILGALAKALNDLGLLHSREFMVVSIGSKSIIASGASAITRILGEQWWITSAWLSPSIRAGLLIRYFTGPYQSHKTRHTDLPQTLTISKLFAPVKLGYTISPHGRLAVLVTTKNGDIEAIKTGLCHVSRLGSKESFVEPLTVYEASLKEDPSVEEVVTPWLTLKECIVKVHGNYVAEKMPIPLNTKELLCYYSTEPCTKLDSNLTRHNVLREAIHPRYPGWARVKLDTSKCITYRVESLNPVFTSEYERVSRHMLKYTRIIMPRV